MAMIAAATVAAACGQNGDQRHVPETADSLVIADKYRTEIKQLAELPKVKEAFKTIEALNAQTRDNHILLTEIPAPPFKEDARAAKFAQMLKDIGADSVWIDPEGNVLALRRGQERSKTVVIEGHLDTVFPEGTDVTVKHKGDTLYAPGIGDDTRGLAMLLTLLKCMNQQGIQTQADILFAGTVGEEGEGDLRGVKYLLEHGPKFDSYIALDGGDIGNITNQGIGSHRYRITFKGPGGHSYGAFGIVNPHFALADALARWDEKAGQYLSKGGPKTTYSAGIIGGGTSVNSIPYESWAVVDMRSEDDAPLNVLDSLLHNAIEESLAKHNAAKKDGPDLTVETKLIGDRPTGTAAPENPLVQRAMAAAAFFDKEPELSASSTNSNAPLAKGLPAVTVGRGGKGGGGHSLNEWWLDDNGDQAIQYALLLLLSEAGLN